jgi:hypothetical protein
MPITYTTTINSMQTVNEPQPNYVVNINFTVNGTDGQYSASTGGTISLSPYAENPTFIPYDSLTEEQIIGWINNVTNNQSFYKDFINAKINDLTNPSVEQTNKPLPWEK